MVCLYVCRLYENTIVSRKEIVSRIYQNKPRFQKSIIMKISLFPEKIHLIILGINNENNVCNEEKSLRSRTGNVGTN